MHSVAKSIATSPAGSVGRCLSIFWISARLLIPLFGDCLTKPARAWSTSMKANQTPTVSSIIWSKLSSDEHKSFTSRWDRDEASREPKNTFSHLFLFRTRESLFSVYHVDFNWHRNLLCVWVELDLTSSGDAFFFFEYADEVELNISLGLPLALYCKKKKSCGI